jgi:ABC-type phosphate/phosphonate transport system substrate-binding protein
MSAAFVASLGMYDFPWTAAANDALWSALAGRLRAAGLEAPPALTRGEDLHDVWRNPQLIFAQTCGYPFVTVLRERVALIATPLYRFEGCEGAAHRSFIVAQKQSPRRTLSDFAGARAAVNARDSNSGMNLFRSVVAPVAGGRRFFGEVIITGSHAASLAAVSEGRADIASIDCVTFGLLQRGRPDETDRVAVLARSPPSPGLPLIMSADLAPKYMSAVREALLATLEDPALAEHRETLGLIGAQTLAPSEYERIAAIEEAALALRYPSLA